MQPHKLYYLVDPLTREIRYVGITKKSLSARLTKHVVHSRTGTDHKCNWIRKLTRFGTRPEINLLQSFDTEADLLNAEKYWIDYFRSAGCDLTNTCAGGRGVLNPSPDTRKKMSLAKKGKPSPNLGRAASESTRRKLSEAHKGQRPWNKGVPTPEIVKEKIRAKKLGKPTWLSTNNLSRDSIERMRRTKSGKPVPAKWKPVLCVTTGKSYPSVKHAAQELRLSPGKISSVCNGKRKSTGGLIFQFSEVLS